MGGMAKTKKTGVSKNWQRVPPTAMPEDIAKMVEEAKVARAGRKRKPRKDTLRSGVQS